MLTRRSFLTAGAAAAGGALLAGCDVPIVGGGGVSREGLRKLVGLSLYADTSWTRCVASGAAEALQGSGYRLLARHADFSAARELANLQSFANRKATGAIVVPVSVESATRGAQAIQQASGAVVNALSPGEGGAGDKYYAALVDSGGEEGGRLVGRWLADHVPGGGEVIVVQGLLGQGVSEPLDRGLQAALAGGEFPIVARGPGNLVAADAVGVVRAALARHPGAKVVVDYGAEMGDGIAGFLQASGRRDVVHVTAGADAATGRWLGTPFLRATRYFSGAQIGRTAAKALLEAVGDDAAQADPLTRTVAQGMRTDLRGAPANCAGPRVAVQPPLRENSATPLPPTETDAGDLG